MSNASVTLNSGISVPPSELCMRYIPECKLQMDSNSTYQLFLNQMYITNFAIKWF